MLQLIIAPLTFLSFLLSLSLIDSYTTSRLSPQNSPPTLRQRITNLAHRMLFKQNPSYKYPATPPSQNAAQAKSSSRFSNEKAKTEKDRLAKKAGEHWYWHTHQRKLMKMEVDDAFKIRHWVLWGMGAAALVLICAGLWVGGKVVGVVMERLNTELPLGSLAGVREVFA